MMSNTFLIIFLTSTVIVSIYAQNSFTVFDTVKSGFKWAETLLKLDHSTGVAKLVSDTFRNSSYTKTKDGHGSSGIITGFLKILGFNAKKIGAIAVNGLIFLAQLLGTSLSIKPPSRLLKARDAKDLHLESPLLWMLENSKVINMITQASDKNLPDQIIEYIKERSLDEETGCIQLLVCKSAPFIWGMQKALTEDSNKNTATKEAKLGGKMVFFHYLPTAEELRENSEKCEEKHHYCFYDEL